MEKTVREAAALTTPSKLYLGVNAYTETPDSVAAKRELAVAYSLRGVAVWRIGLLSPGFLDACRPPASGGGTGGGTGGGAGSGTP